MTPIEQAAATPTVFVPAQRPAPQGAVAPLRPVVPVGTPPHRRLMATVLAALVCGALGLLVAPVLLGPAAIVGGLTGEHIARRGTSKAGAAAVLTLTIAALTLTLALRWM